MLVKILIFIFAFLIMHQLFVESEMIEGFRKIKSKAGASKTGSSKMGKMGSIRKEVVKKCEGAIEKEKKRCEDEITTYRNKIEQLEEQLASIERSKQTEEVVNTEEL